MTESAKPSNEQVKSPEKNINVPTIVICYDANHVLNIYLDLILEHIKKNSSALENRRNEAMVAEIVFLPRLRDIQARNLDPVSRVGEVSHFVKMAQYNLQQELDAALPGFTVTTNLDHGKRYTDQSPTSITEDYNWSKLQVFCSKK